LTALWGVRQCAKSASALPFGLPALPEADGVRRAASPVVTPAGAAVVPGFRAQAARAGVIQLASRAPLKAANPMYSTLMLGPAAAVPASELLRMPLPARLVFSACETASGKTAPRAGWGRFSRERGL
jgi:hypothetical protein